MNIDEKNVKGRFAPSPTGRMHLGNVFSALLSWLSVKIQGGDWLLRIEDIDPQRSKQHYADQIMRDLEWLGITWDEGPYYQSQRGDIYEEHLNKLQSQGLLYHSYKTRAERLAVSAPQEKSPSPRKTPLSPLVSRGAETPKWEGAVCSATPNILLKVSDEVITYNDLHYGEQRVDVKKEIGDFIVRRRDGAWAYQLAVVVDDALMGITEVVRGRDLLQSAGQQIYLGGLLGFPRMQYAHLPLLCNEAGQRLSKRDKSMDLGQLQEHHSAEDIIGHLAFLAHITDKDEPCLPSDLIPLFDWQKVPLKDIPIS